MALAELVETKRINFHLSERAHAELQRMSRETHRSMTELLRLALGLLKVAFEADRNGHKIVIASADGNPVKEIVLPAG